MRLNKIFKQTLAVAGFVFLIVACDDDFSSVGTNIVGEVNFDTELADGFKVSAYSRNFADGTSFNGVQTNNAPVGTIGFYNDPVYGSSTSSFLSQVTLSQFDPDFGDNTVLDSVIFSMPYFSTLEETDEDGNSTYTLDSIFNNTGDMTLSLYRSDFFLNSLDPLSGFQDPEIYFSNEVSTFAGIESELIFEHTSFSPDDSEIVLFTPIEDDNGDIANPNDLEESERVTPRLRLRLDRPSNITGVTTGVFDWNEAILAREGQNVLLNQNSFIDYFRGLYLKAEDNSGLGSYMLLNPAQTNITIYYSFENEPSDDGIITATSGTGNIVLSFMGVNAIELENDFNQSPIGDVGFNTSQNTVDGEESLYLKGGDGAISIIDLFGRDEDGFSDELEQLRSCNVIINEANLTFFVDSDQLGSAGTGVLEPERIFIYDFDNNISLADSSIDGTIGLDGPVDTGVNHLGRLTRETEGDLSSDGLSYRVRLTQHINNIVRNDSTNVRLALAVSQNVTDNTTSFIGGLEDEEGENRIPASSIISPEGTILHGSTSPIEASRLRLRIYYTVVDEIDPNSPCAEVLGL